MNVKSTELNGKSLVSWKSVFGTRRLPGHRPEQSLQAAHVDGNVRKQSVTYYYQHLSIYLFTKTYFLLLYLVFMEYFIKCAEFTSLLRYLTIEHD